VVFRQSTVPRAKRVLIPCCSLVWTAKRIRAPTCGVAIRIAIVLIKYTTSIDVSRSMNKGTTKHDTHLQPDNNYTTFIHNHRGQRNETEEVPQEHIHPSITHYTYLPARNQRTTGTLNQLTKTHEHAINSVKLCIILYTENLFIVL
jgi:hypothetical protein